MFLAPRRPTRSSITSLALGLPLLFAVSAHATQKFPKCCVWRVTNAKAPFYLVGSIHALSKKDYPLPAPYEISLRESKRFLFEFDPTKHVEFEKKFEAAGRYPRGQDLRSKIDPELLAWLRQNITTLSPENHRARRERKSSFDNELGYKPWWIAQHIVGPATYTKTSLSHGLDNYFVDRALRERKEIAGLESVDEHVAVMGGLSDRDSEFILRDTLEQPRNADREFTRMYKAWRKGDTNALWKGDSRLRKQAPWIAARFVDDRNVKWIPRIEAELKSGKPTSIVAGALHFSGPNSVIKLLEKRGYKIEQL
ncbi:MAG TPA: TraB/GumN family protein [Candidatus Udaeobacter sp.]|nr:TraB/GumN family protein [Candidatus Udaeobacter sp.]